ncbi:radical SAM protein [Granulicella sp. dw_53]|uniref:radical SAM protein n=1 Tax=Granulicella sp. dw_53 TaxID=2719792 RepID=UPI001BD4F133|nr:radical SAM protein [Granulicella sp. dw_53]
MKSSEVMQAWKSILTGRRPSLSIEITRECPLRCPGCYAYDPAHLGGDGNVTLRQLSDYKNDELVRNVLHLVDIHQPLHVSIVGGDPLVRFRELEAILPELDRRGIYVQIVTSAFRPIPAHWADFKRLSVVVSIDGLQPEHDVRRAPATYERILKNLAQAKVTVHCTITGQIASRPGYLEEFLRFWTERPEVNKVWMSLFTPQIGAEGPELLTPAVRAAVIEELLRLRPLYPILDMHELAIREYMDPPKSPADCIFARTTHSVSADLKTVITPCQFGGQPDCSQCGCFASMGLAAVGHYKVAGGLTAGHLFKASDIVGQNVSRLLHSKKQRSLH